MFTRRRDSQTQTWLESMKGMWPWIVNQITQTMSQIYSITRRWEISSFILLEVKLCLWVPKENKQWGQVFEMTLLIVLNPKAFTCTFESFLGHRHRYFTMKIVGIEKCISSVVDSICLLYTSDAADEVCRV